MNFKLYYFKWARHKITHLSVVKFTFEEKMDFLFFLAVSSFAATPLPRAPTTMGYRHVGENFWMLETKKVCMSFSENPCSQLCAHRVD